jgi:hypothetical protein
MEPEAGRLMAEAFDKNMIEIAPEEAVERIDGNTIGVVAILGTP